MVLQLAGPCGRTCSSRARFESDRSIHHGYRLSRSRGIAVRIHGLESRWLGVLGEPRVNVLLLNLALDRLK
jgi:hypothetical protein